MSQLIVSLACCLLLTNAVSADPADHLQRLDDEDFATRQSATEAMLAEPDLNLQILAQLYDQSETPEQQHRLRAVGLHLALTEVREESFGQLQGADRGSLGIVHSVEPMVAGELEMFDIPGVDVAEPQPIRLARVIRVLPGFPAYGKLREGDKVLRVQGQLLDRRDSRSALEIALRRFSPDDTIDLHILRDSELIVVQIKLVRSLALTTMYGAADVRLSAPFDRLAAARLESVGMSLP
jgi:hypothetical protein